MLRTREKIRKGDQINRALKCMLKDLDFTFEEKKKQEKRFFCMEKDVIPFSFRKPNAMSSNSGRCLITIEKTVTEVLLCARYAGH
jgi:hypothetical protein